MKLERGDLVWISDMERYLGVLHTRINAYAGWSVVLFDQIFDQNEPFIREFADRRLHPLRDDWKVPDRMLALSTEYKLIGEST